MGLQRVRHDWVTELNWTEADRRGRQRMTQLHGITNSVDMSLSKLQEIVKDREAGHAAVHGITKSQIQLSNNKLIEWKEYTPESLGLKTGFCPWLTAWPWASLFPFLCFIVDQHLPQVQVICFLYKTYNSVVDSGFSDGQDSRKESWVVCGENKNHTRWRRISIERP